MDNILGSFLMQLAGQPVLLVYLVGMVLALVFWRRCPTPCAFTLIATALLILTSMGQTFVSTYLIHARADLGWEHERLNWMLAANGMIGSFVRALAFGLLLSAVFVGRKPPRQTWAEESAAPDRPREHGASSHDIKPA